MIDEIRRVASAGPPLRLVVMFGSHAKDRARPDSDVDIAILPRDSALSIVEESQLAAELAKALRREVDLVRIDRVSTLLRWQIAKDGVLIAAQPAVEWVRFRASAASEHADFVESLRDGAERYRRRLARSA